MYLITKVMKTCRFNKITTLSIRFLADNHKNKLS